ncbi:MAG: hypothetical protein WC229_03590 [Candidatus Paceibacterota bacterium]|jgi:hypothetical protein
MSVEFDQENSFDKKFERTIAKKKGSKMNAFLIKHYFAKNEKQANMILLGVSLVSLLLTAVILNVSVFGGSFFNKKTLSPNAKIMQEYKDQGLSGKALMDKIREDKKTGISK